MYSAKRVASPTNSLYRNNPDPYLGSGSHNGDRNSNGSGQDDFDLSVSQPSNFSGVTPDLAPPLPSYLDSADNAELGSNDSFSTNITRSRPSSGPSEKFGMDQKINSADFRPSSTNSFTGAKNNSLLDSRRSPLSVSGAQIHSSGVPSPLSPQSIMHRVEKDPCPLIRFPHPLWDINHLRSSPYPQTKSTGLNIHNMFLPLTKHGPSPSLPGHPQHIPGYMSPAGSNDSNLPPHAYPNQGSSFDYSNNSYRRKQNSSVDSDCQNRPPQTGSGPPNKNERQGQPTSENDQNKRVIVPAGKMLANGLC